MDEERTIEILEEVEGVPVAAIVRDPARRIATYHVILPVVTHTGQGHVIAPTKFAFCLN